MFSKLRRKKSDVFTIDLNGHVFEAKSTKSILDSALKANVDINYSCGNGVCLQCRMFVESGQIDNKGENKSQSLACQSFPKSDLVIHQY